MADVFGLADTIDALSDFFPSRVTFQQATESKNALYEKVSTWADVAGYIGLGCAVAASGGGEQKSPVEIVTVSDYTMSVTADLTAIIEKMRAVVTGPNAGTYDVLKVSVSSHGVLSRVQLRWVR